MSIEFKSNTKIERSSEKNFGITFSIIFFIIFLYLYFSDFSKTNIYAYVFLIISLSFLIFSFFYKNIFFYPNLYWYKFGMLLSLIISPIIMFAVFCIAFVLFGFIIKKIKGDLLNTKFDKNKKTYWEIRNYEIQDMKNQF